MSDPDRSLHVSMAKAQASEAALAAARAALQCHGAIGYTFEYDLHLWMKRAWALAAAWGDAAWHRARVGAAILSRRSRVMDRSLHRRRRPHPGRQAQRGPRRGAPGRPRRARDPGPRRAQPASIPLAVDDVIFGCVDTIGPQAGDIARTALARRRAARGGARHHRRPPVRLVPAGRALRRPGGDERDRRPRRRRRRAEHEHDPDRARR